MHKIRLEKRTIKSEVIVRGKRDIKQNKQNRNWLYFNFSFETSSSYLTILKRKNLSLPLKDETDQFVICLRFCQSVFLSKLHFTLGQ